MCVLSACSNETQSSPTVPVTEKAAVNKPAAGSNTPAAPKANGKPLTVFTPEQTTELAAYFGISLSGIASAEQTKIVPGAVKNGIQVTAADVLSYADTKGTEKTGSVTARLSGTYGGQTFENVEVSFTGFMDLYGSSVQSAGKFTLDFADAIQSAQNIDAYITAANEQPQKYIKEFSFGLKNGTLVDALDTNNRSYSVKNIQLKKAADATRIQADAQFQVHYFSRKPGKDEAKETVSYGWRYRLPIETPYYTKTDVLNYILQDPRLIPESGNTNSHYASELYAKHRFLKVPVWGQLFNNDTVKSYQKLYPAYGELFVAIQDISANDLTGELHVTYCVASHEDSETHGYRDSSRYETRTFTGFKQVDEKVLLETIAPYIMIAPTERHTLYEKYDKKFKAGIEAGKYQITDTQYKLDTIINPQPVALVRDTGNGILVGDGKDKDNFSNNKRKIMFGSNQSTIFDIFGTEPPYLANEEFYINQVEIQLVSVTVNPTEKRNDDDDYVYRHNYEVSFYIQSSQTVGSTQTDKLTIPVSIQIWK